MSEFAKMVKRSRSLMPERLGYDETWTQSDLASIVGVSPNYWARVERGEELPGEQFKRCLDYAMQLASEGRDPRAKSVW